MPLKIIQYFKKTKRKALSLLFVTLVLLAISSILLPIYINYSIQNKKSIQLKEISKIETETLSIYKEREKKILDAGAEIKRRLAGALQSNNSSYGSLVKVLNLEKFDDYSVEVVAPNGKLIGWNDQIAIAQKEIFPLFFSTGNVYFNSADLQTWLTLIDTINIDGDPFYIFVSKPFEKKYQIQNIYYKEYSFIKYLNNTFLNQFEIDFSPYADLTKDGRKYSFPLLNNKDMKIGVISFTKPSLNTQIEKIKGYASTVQAIILLFAILLLGIGLKDDYKKLNNELFKFTIYSLYLLLIRIVLYNVGLPAKFMSGSLADPSNFSSAWGGGIVKSPIEFFITNIFVLLICLNIYKKINSFLVDNESNKYLNKFYYLIAFISTIMFFWVARGLAAVLKSIISDSSYKYFNEPEIIPGLVSFMMNLNVLFISFSVLLLLIGFLNFVVKFYLIRNKHINIKIFLFELFLVYVAFSIAFFYLQKNPLIPLLHSFLLLVLVFILMYQIIIFKPNNIYNFAYIALAASIFSITLLNTFNLGVEKESLKNIALDILRTDENYNQFLLNETIDNALNDENINKYFNSSKTNLNSAAFIIWSKSILQKEGIVSSLTIYDNYLNKTGSFSVEFESMHDSTYLDKIKGNKIKSRIFYNILTKSNKLEYVGISPIIQNEIILGYIIVKIIDDPKSIGYENFPEFLNPHLDNTKAPFNAKDLKIIQLINGAVSKVFGNIYPSKEQVEPIVKAKFSPENDCWINLSINNENFITYIIKSSKVNNESLLAVSLREKQFTWNLFNFFKFFIVHSFLILILIAILFAFNSHKLKYSFRLQLLITFFTISIIPILLLAVYNREMVSQKSAMSISDELGIRVDYLKNFIEFNFKSSDSTNSLNVFQNAANELKISFAVYQDANQIFNSKEDYFNAGLFNSKLNSIAYYYLNYLNYQELLSEDKIENYNYNTYYKKITLGNNNYVMGVNDAFNKVNLTMNINDVDVFLFGVYSLAVIIIIILSTVLANKISLPIRKLTKATEAIAHGDLSINIENNEKGEIKDLIDGFNLMTSELKKNEMQLAELERENAWKEMAKQVAHEIKNPLTPMKLLMQQLIASYNENSSKFDKVFSKISTTILNQIESLNQIASEFSRFARMPNYNLEKLNIIPLLYEVQNLFFDEKISINIITSIEVLEADLDKSQIRRLLINLIRNAIEAKSSIINISVNFQNDLCYIDIQDNGGGISKNIINKIFEPNFTTKDKGMGIGLKLGKRFIDSIGGKLEVTNSSKDGTSFLISLPAKRES